MSDRVSATIVIGGRVPAPRLDELARAIEAEDVGPDWDAGFDGREAILAHLADGAGGVTFRRHEVRGGEFCELQAACVSLGLTYVLTYDGYGGEWGAGRRVRRPGDAGEGVSCALDADVGFACISAADIRRLGFTDLRQVLARLAMFDHPQIPALLIEG